MSSSRYTHFIAFQLNNPNVVEKMKGFIDDYIKTFPESMLKNCSVEISRSHITVKLIKVPKGREDEAKAIFRKITTDHAREFKGFRVTLESIGVMNLRGGGTLVHTKVNARNFRSKILNLARDYHSAYERKLSLIHI